MIDDPPLIRLRRAVPRPTEAQLAALRGTPTGYVVDALFGDASFGPEVKPVVPEQAAFCGVAVTCQVGPADNLAVFAALPLLQKSDVIVAAASGFRLTAVVGDLVLGMAKNCGAVAFLTDGCVRDVPGIRDVGLPCFATGVTPNSPVKNGPGTVNLPVILSGRTVQAGDVVIGDCDGAVVIPFAQIDRVIAALAVVREAEAKLVAKVSGGLRYPDWVTAMQTDGRIVEVD